MPRNTRFSTLWLDGKKDNDGHSVSSWCRECPEDAYSAFCAICNKKFSVANMGFAQILSHANGIKHKQRAKGTVNQATFTFAKKQLKSEESSGVSKNYVPLSIINCKNWIPASLREKTLKAEALILLTAIKCNYSFASLDSLGCIFSEAFGDSEIAKNVKLSGTKARYVVKFGLAPYFKKKIFSDYTGHFVVHFDETTTKQIKKQLDIYISYWSKSSEQVVTYYCESFFLGHAGASKILEVVLKFLSENNLNIDKLIQCSMDGPNVNLRFIKDLNLHLDTLKLRPIIDIGPCSLHIVHNAVKKGISELECDVENFVLNVFYWFKQSAARREDYHEIQLSELIESFHEHFFLRHVESRWLTLGPVCERIIEQYAALKIYFLEFLPKQNIKFGEKYNVISNFLKDPNTLVTLNFVCFYSNIFVSYLNMFQKTSPLIHVIFRKQCELIRNIMLKFLKQSVVQSKEGLPLKNINYDDGKNWLSLNLMDVGSATKKLISYPEDKDFLHSVRKVYLTTCKYLLSHLPIKNPILHDLKYIHPDQQKNPKAVDGIHRLSQLVLKITKTDAESDKIKSEFLTYTCEDLSIEQDLYLKTQDICMFWREVSKKRDAVGDLKYQSLYAFVGSCLILSHGNAIPERGFSVNNRLVTQEKTSFSEVGIKAIRLCKDFLIKEKDLSNLINRDMIEFMKRAYHEYSSYLDQLKEEKAKAASKRKLEEEENENDLKIKKQNANYEAEIERLKKEENVYTADEAAAIRLLNEATEKLDKALKNNNFSEVKLSYMMLDTANKSIKDLNTKLNVTRNLIEETKNKIKKNIST